MNINQNLDLKETHHILHCQVRYKVYIVSLFEKVDYVKENFIIPVGKIN